MPYSWDYVAIPDEYLRKALTTYGQMPYVADPRPFKTLARYIRLLDGPLGIDGDGTLVLVHPHQYRKLEKVSVPRLLYRVMREVKVQRNKAKTCYDRMCLDEDEEELQFLLDMYHQFCSKNKKTAMPAETQPPKDKSSDVEDYFPDESDFCGISKEHKDAPFWVLC